MDGAIAVSFLVAGVRTVRHGDVAAWIVGGVQVAVALAFVWRTAERRAGGWAEVAAALPSLVLAGVVFAGGVEWSGPATVLAALGAGITLGGMASLGRSFAVLPGVRELRTGGLYRFVRHPIYLGEAIILAAAASCVGPWAVVLAALAVVLLAWRIQAEERLLGSEPGWSAFAARVRFRLVPGVW